jgi:hypothetical protein
VRAPRPPAIGAVAWFAFAAGRTNRNDHHDRSDRVWIDRDLVTRHLSLTIIVFHCREHHAHPADELHAAC